MKTLKILSIVTCFIIVISLPAVSQVVQDHIKENTLIIPTVCWEEKLKSTSSQGQVLCVNRHTLKSKVVNGKIASSFTAAYCDSYIDILGCTKEEDPTFFLVSKYLQFLKNKNVTTSYANGENGFNTIQFDFNNNTYSLAHKVLMKYEKNQSLYNITLCKNDACNEIVRLVCDDPYQAGGNPTLVWAGDIDNDKELDLLLIYNALKFTRNVTLFLSSYADKGKLVKPIAKNTLISD